MQVGMQLIGKITKLIDSLPLDIIDYKFFIKTIAMRSLIVSIGDITDSD